jgi:hypothetical protein
MALVEFEGDAPWAIDCHRIALRIRVQRMSFVTRTRQVGQIFGFIDNFQDSCAASAQLGRYCGCATRFKEFLESLVAEALDHEWEDCSTIRDILSTFARHRAALSIDYASGREAYLLTLALPPTGRGAWGA